MCHDHDAELRVQDPLSRKIVTRHINVGAAAPNARARLIAIATSELVLASWSELETNPDPRWSQPARVHRPRRAKLRATG